MWKPDRILKVILIWTVVTMLLVWLPLVRGVMDGESYQWGASFWGKQFSGSGVRGDYWLLIVRALVGITILYLGWRGANQPFHWLLLLWHNVGIRPFSAPTENSSHLEKVSTVTQSRRVGRR